MDRNNSFNEAVDIVRTKLSPESAKIIQYSIENNKDDRAELHRVGFGVAIRNLLAEHGLMWEDVILYSVWFAILQEATKTLLE